MIELRHYQKEAVAALIGNKRGICVAPAGAGKTIIAAKAIELWSNPRAAWKKRPMRVLWLAMTTDQCDQAQDAIDKFPTDSARIEVMCIQGADNLAEYDLILVDECHHIAAQTYRKVVERHSGWIWGVTATPHRADDQAHEVYRLIGPVVYVVQREILIHNGQLAPCCVVFHAPNTPAQYKAKIDDAARQEFESQMRRFGRFSKVDPSELQKRCIWRFAQQIGVFGNDERANKVVQLANYHAGNGDHALVIVDKIEFGQELQARIPGSLLVYSKIGKRKRAEAIDAFRAGAANVLLATSLADEGLDVPRANVLIMAGSGRSKAKAEQRTGRVLRAFQGKERGIVHDFWDHQHYFLLAQSKARKRTYETLNYRIINNHE